jgi:hypothetical protein
LKQEYQPKQVKDLEKDQHNQTNKLMAFLFLFSDLYNMLPMKEKQGANQQDRKRKGKTAGKDANVGKGMQ